jgi:acyl carrier protein
MPEYALIARRIRSFLAARCGTADLPAPDEADLVDEGILDSLQLLEVLEFLEEEFGVPPSQRLLMGETAFSIRSLAQEVLEHDVIKRNRP